MGGLQDKVTAAIADIVPVYKQSSHISRLNREFAFNMLLICFLDGLVGMAIVGGIGLGLAGLAGLIGLAVAKKSA